ncbi:hypothetical protein HD554DRAFT_2080235 [Boletus coccyginus]|nr:hypothetical protein HD554DRAFT_2080235 [Boletus coccyginus]
MPRSTGELTLAQKSILKAHFARSCAISSTHNRRNLEAPWYSAWCHTLTQLVEDFADLIVCPQYTIYFTPESPEDEEEEGDGEEEDSLREEEFPDVNMGPSGKPPQCPTDESTFDDVTDISDASFSTIGTKPDKDADNLITDFAVIKVSPKRVNAFHGRYGGWRIMQISLPLLVENKRYPKRKLKGNESVSDMLPLIIAAMEQVEVQAAYTFQQYPHMKSLIGVAACGPWWTRAVLTPELVHRHLEFLPDRKRPKPKWERTLKLNTPSSDRRLQELQEMLQEM